MSSSYESVGTTAFVIAQWRLEETEEANPLFLDHVANVFLNDELAQAAHRIAKASPSTRFLVRYRTRYFDDIIRERISRDGVEQFLILGSGLDTRAIRLLGEGESATFYEVDQHHVLEFKRKQLETFGYRLATRFVDAEYTSVDYLAALEQQGFDFGRRTFILWEGNVFYLPRHCVLKVLQDLAERLTCFEIAFDYLSKKLIAQATGFRKSGALLGGFSSLGAPWLTGFDELGELRDATGLAVGTDFFIADYVNELGVGIQVDRQLFDDYRIGILGKNVPAVRHESEGQGRAAAAQGEGAVSS